MKEAIKRFRKEKHMSQRTLAKLLDLSETCIKNWESGKFKPNRRSQKDLKRIGVEIEEGANEMPV